MLVLMISPLIVLTFQANLTISVHPLALPPSTLRHLPFTFSQLTNSILDPHFILWVTVSACSGRVEESELGHLPQPLQDRVVVSGVLPSLRETQLRALDILLWMGLVHSTNAESWGYSLLSSVVGRLLISLVHSCFVVGDRMLSHKCSQLILMLYK